MVCGGALMQRRGKDIQTEVMKQRLCASAPARTRCVYREYVFFCLCFLFLFFSPYSIWLTNKGNKPTRLPLHICYYSGSLIQTYCCVDDE